MYFNKINKKSGVLSDQVGKLEIYYSLKDYPEKLRRIKYHDKETGKTLVFLSNNFDLKAEEIALLYKYRWKIELFFKLIKQHLKIKSFWGTPPNAVKTQIYSAIIFYCLVAIISYKLKEYSNKPLTETQKARNKEKSSIRARVEHVFGFVENSMHGSIVCTIGIARAKAIPIIIGRDDSSREIAKLLFHRMNLTYNICRCTQLKRVVAMG